MVVMPSLENIVSRFRGNREKIQTTRRKTPSSFSQIGERRERRLISEEEVKDNGIPYEASKEWEKIVEDEKDMRIKLNRAYSIYDRLFSAGSIVNTTFLRNPAASYFLIYDTLLAAYGYRVSSKNYTPDGIEDKIAKYGFVAGLATPVAYLLYLNQIDAGVGLQEWIYAGLQGLCTATRIVSDCYRRKHEKVIKDTIRAGCVTSECREAMERCNKKGNNGKENGKNNDKNGNNLVRKR